MNTVQKLIESTSSFQLDIFLSFNIEIFGLSTSFLLQLYYLLVQTEIAMRNNLQTRLI